MRARGLWRAPTALALAAALVTALVPRPALGQGAAGTPSDADMRVLMEAMQGMQACMAGVDQAALQRLQQRAEQAEAEMRRLCRAGQAAAAQERALRLGRQIADDPALQTMQACMARLPQLPGLRSAAPLGQLTFDEEPIEGHPQSICERLN